MKQLAFPLIASAILFAGPTACSKEIQTVEWYKAHDTERMAVIRECKENADKLNKTENCINAKRANLDVLRGG
jgi:hypothetical protein